MCSQRDEAKGVENLPLHFWIVGGQEGREREREGEGERVDSTADMADLTSEI